MSGVDKTGQMIRRVGEEVAKWNKLRFDLEELDVDPEHLFDTLDGETELREALLLLSEEVAEREAMDKAVGSRIKQLQERKSRIENSVKTLRTIILFAMDRANIPNIRGDLSTLAVSEVPPKAEITQEERIPSRFWKTEDPKLDMKALTQALKDGETVEGARLSGKGMTLNIRSV